MSVFRREIALINYGNSVQAGLEDDFHAFELSVAHNEKQVTDVSARAHRFPLSTCPLATNVIAGLVGSPLSPNCREIGKFSSSRNHCTHLFDLAGLAITHSQRPVRKRNYGISVSYASQKSSLITFVENGVTRLELSVVDNVVTTKGVFSGQDLGVGFSSWVLTAFPDFDDREIALVLQRAWFVSGGRRKYQSGATAKARLREIKSGACYGYNYNRFPQLSPISNAERDFTDRKSDMLKFMNAS